MPLPDFRKEQALVISKEISGLPRRRRVLHSLFLTGVFALSSLSALAERRIAFVPVGDIDASIIQRVVSYVEENLGTSITVMPQREPGDGAALEGEIAPLIPLLDPTIHSIVAIVLPGNAVTKPNVFIDAERKIALVNARGLLPADQSDLEVYGRRLEKESIAAIATMFGLTPNPTPDCATFRYRDEKGLDRKGRNLCPPQLIRFRQAAKEAGLAGHPPPEPGAVKPAAAAQE